MRSTAQIHKTSCHAIFSQISDILAHAMILTFFNAAGLFVLIGAEFIAMILVVVYVGAVAVLFLFVVMMLDISFVEMRQGFLQYLPIGGLVGIVLLAELLVIVGGFPSFLLDWGGAKIGIFDF